MGKKGDRSDGSKKASRSFRNRERRRRSRKQLKSEPFDWNSIAKKPKNPFDRASYPYRASAKCFRESENLLPTECDNYAIHWKERTPKGKLRWFIGFLQRSHRDHFLRICDPKRKPRKEANFQRVEE